MSRFETVGTSQDNQEVQRARALGRASGDFGVAEDLVVGQEEAERVAKERADREATNAQALEQMAQQIAVLDEEIAVLEALKKAEQRIAETEQKKASLSPDSPAMGVYDKALAAFRQEAESSRSALPEAAGLDAGGIADLIDRKQEEKEGLVGFREASMN